jgi:hypothetical protein
VSAVNPSTTPVFSVPAAISAAMRARWRFAGIIQGASWPVRQPKASSTGCSAPSSHNRGAVWVPIHVSSTALRVHANRVEAIGGKMTVSSQLGQEASLLVTIPLELR